MAEFWNPAGVVLRADGGCLALPGLQGNALLVPRSPVLAAPEDVPPWLTGLAPTARCGSYTGPARRSRSRSRRPEPPSRRDQPMHAFGHRAQPG